MPHIEGSRLMADFKLSYVPEGDQAVIIGLHVPGPEEAASGFTPHWEPLINFDWNKAQMFLDSHASLSPIVERKRELEHGDLMADEAWAFALKEMWPGPQT